MTNGEKFKEVFGFGADGSRVIAVNATWWDCEFQNRKPITKRVPPKLQGGYEGEKLMYDELIKQLKELASIPEHCENVANCYKCPKEEICLSFTNKRIIEVVAQAAEAIEDLTAYVQQIEELCKDGYYLEKTKMTPYGQAIMTGPLPQLPKKVGKLHVGKYGVASITEIPGEETEE